VNYIQLLLTPADVDVLVTALKEIDAVPLNVRPFLDPRVYLQEIDYQSFWVRVYSKKPPLSSFVGYRNVVFREQINNFEHVEDPDFERLWRELSNLSASRGEPPVLLVRRSNPQPRFTDYVIRRSLDDLSERASVFEQHLVHSMYLRTLIDWSGYVKYYYELIAIPTAAARIIRELKTLNLTKLSAFNPCIAALVTNFPLIEYPLIVHAFLPLVLTKERAQQLARIEALWTVRMMESRSELALPEALQRVKVHQRLWEAIEHLKCIAFVGFGSCLQVVLEALTQLEELAEIDDVVLRFAAVYCDCSRLLRHFLVLNALVVRGGADRLFGGRERELVLWYKFEAAILKLVTADSRLLARYLACQSDFMAVKFK
jgi:hypothetical protein